MTTKAATMTKITIVIVAIDAKVQSERCFRSGSPLFFYAFVVKALENPALHQVCFYDLRPSPFFSSYRQMCFLILSWLGGLKKKNDKYGNVG